MMISPMLPSTLASSVRRHDAPSDDTPLRQLRHQTKNTLQRVMCQIAACRELQANPHGARLLEDLERRIRLSSVVSDALYGVVSQPGPLQDRMQRLCGATTELMGDTDQLIKLQVAVDATVPAALEEALLRIAHEFVGNAVKHGLYARTVGAVTVRVDRVRRAVRLTVLDDGWGFGCEPEPGEGLRLATLLAAQQDGSVSLVRRGGLTVAEALLQPGG